MNLYGTIVIMKSHWNKYVYFWISGINNHKVNFLNSRFVSFIVQEARNLKSRAFIVLSGSFWRVSIFQMCLQGLGLHGNTLHGIHCLVEVPLQSASVVTDYFTTFYLYVHNLSFNSITTMGPRDHLVQYGFNNFTCKDPIPSEVTQ